MKKKELEEKKKQKEKKKKSKIYREGKKYLIKNYMIFLIK